MQTLTITRPDDWHLHLRDGPAMKDALAHSASVFARAIVMPNLKPPVTRTEQAKSYRDRIVAALAPGHRFEPLMTLYLTDVTPAEEIRRARDSGIVHAVKLYPAGAIRRQPRTAPGSQLASFHPKVSPPPIGTTRSAPNGN